MHRKKIKGRHQNFTKQTFRAKHFTKKKNLTKKKDEMGLDPQGFRSLSDYYQNMTGNTFFLSLTMFLKIVYGGKSD